MINNNSNDMKTLLSYFVMLVLTSSPVFSEIKNGYEKDILITRKSLKNLRNVLVETREIQSVQKKKIELKINSLVNYISYYELTENLLSQFKIIAPGLYNEIDTIKDRMGRPVDVYVKFVPIDHASVKAWGTTYISQLENDPDAYLSEYGEFTVSVKVWIVAEALMVLSHEFGHVKYQVLNLSSYVKFYKDHYPVNPEFPNYMGHDPGDPSGKSAFRYEKIFRRDFAGFVKITTEKIQNPLAMISKIKKQLNINRPVL